MKNLAILLLTMITFVGCMDDNSILEPTNDLAVDELHKGRPILGRDFDYFLYDSLGTIRTDDISQFGNELIDIGDDKYDDDSRELDDFVDEDGYQVRYSKNFTVNGHKATRLAVKHRWWDENGEMVWLEAELFIPRGAFEGELTFDMVFDIENYSMELYPSPYTFKKPVEFCMGWYGLDLEKLKRYEFNFNYLDGKEEDIKYFKKEIDFEKGNLVIWDAQLHHFSRYGWTRSKEPIIKELLIN